MEEEVCVCVCVGGGCYIKALFFWCETPPPALFAGVFTCKETRVCTGSAFVVKFDAAIHLELSGHWPGSCRSGGAPDLHPSLPYNQLHPTIGNNANCISMEISFLRSASLKVCAAEFVAVSWGHVSGMDGGARKVQRDLFLLQHLSSNGLHRWDCISPL